MTAVVRAVVPAWARAADPPAANLPAIPEDGETYTLQGRDNVGAGGGNDPIRFWGHPNAVPNTPGTAAGVGRALTVIGENDRDYTWRDQHDVTARQGVATLTPIVQANRRQIAELEAAGGTGVGKLRGVFAPSVQAYHDVSAYLTTQVAGERNLDLALVLQPAAFGVELWRFNTAPDPSVWERQATWWQERPLAWATRGNGERMPDGKLPEALPFANMRAKLFDSDVETAIAGADVTIAFDVDNVIGGETIAMPGQFNVTAEQVAEDDAQLRITYDMTDAVRVGMPPTETELILRTVGTGIVLASLPVHDRHADTLTFDLSSLNAATALRWAIIVKTKGRYHGNITISAARFHSSDGQADPFIRRVASKLVNALSSVVTALTARVAALEDAPAGGIPASGDRYQINGWLDESAARQNGNTVYRYREPTFLFTEGRTPTNDIPPGATHIMVSPDAHGDGGFLYEIAKMPVEVVGGTMETPIPIIQPTGRTALPTLQGCVAIGKTVDNKFLVGAAFIDGITFSNVRVTLRFIGGS